LTTIGLQHFVTFKTRMADRNVSNSWVRNIIHALKTLLTYARDVLDIPVMDITRIKAPRVPRKPVLYVSPEDLEKFLAAIRLETLRGEPRQAGYCLRALVEILLATGMRISEALKLNLNDVHFETREAKVLGKRNRPRVVFFTERSLEWLKKYLALRQDSNSALLVSANHSRLTVDSVGDMFRRTKQWAGLTSPFTPHILRHTTATTLLRNGCPIGYIKELLGHQDLQTTCRYYLGTLDHTDVKQAHDKYLLISND
jgi:integrase/recombinase XerD